MEICIQLASVVDLATLQDFSKEGVEIYQVLSSPVTTTPTDFLELEGQEKFEQFRLPKHTNTERTQTRRGLGRDESGISEAIKPTLKFDKAGVGHNQGDDFSFHWWDHVYKKAADNIVVEHSEDGVAMKQVEAQEDLISTKKWKHKKKKKKSKSTEPVSLTYGVFMKSATLTEVGEVKDPHIAAVPSSDDDDNLFHHSEQDHVTFKACEGRTAHKGARHGLTASGKLRRLEAQEMGLPAPLSKKGNKTSSTEDRTIPKRAEYDEAEERTLNSGSQPTTKVKKRKKRDRLISGETRGTVLSTQVLTNGTASPSREDTDLGAGEAVGSGSSMGKMTKKKKRRCEQEIQVIPSQGGNVNLDRIHVGSCTNNVPVQEIVADCTKNVANGVAVGSGSSIGMKKKKRKQELENGLQSSQGESADSNVMNGDSCTDHILGVGGEYIGGVANGTAAAVANATDEKRKRKKKRKQRGKRESS